MNVVRFGVFEADLAAGELRKNGRKIRVQDLPFRVLAILVERPGEVVSRDELREKLWPADTYVDFDRSLNTAVAKLRSALGDSGENPRFVETLPRRGYRFLADVKVDGQAPVPVEEPAESGEAAPTSKGSGSERQRRSPWWVLAPVALAVAVAVTAVILLRDSRQGDAQLTAVPFTSDPGSETQPALSPDGTQVAYCSTREGEETADIYVKMIGTGEPLRRTTDPADDYNPVWSPDGTEIAFLRRLGAGRPEVRIMPALRGPEQKVAEVGIPYPYLCGPRARSQMLAWHPDGRHLAISDVSEGGVCIFLLSLETKQRRRLTAPPRQTDWGDVGPAFSPDGRRLVFARHLSMTAADLFLQGLTKDLEPAGEPRRLTSQNAPVTAPVWTPDGSAVLFSSSATGSADLWRIPMSGRGVPLQIAHVGERGLWPTVSQGADRLVYARAGSDIDIWQVEVDEDRQAVGAPAKFISSTYTDTNPRFSPDGEQIVFRSDRSGSPEIWVCDSDGSNWRQMTRFGGQQTGAATWSPDGGTIGFTSWREGTGDIYVVSADGGEQKKLTTSPFSDQNPEWSPDGKWIYFGSLRSGQREIWRMPAGGGPKEQVTTNGTRSPIRIDEDGAFIYFAKGRYRDAELWRLPVEGGEEELVLDSLYSALHFAPHGDGVYFISAPDAENRWYLEYLDLATRQTQRIVELLHSPHGGLSVSPAGRYVLYPQSYGRESDLMLVEGFR